MNLDELYQVIEDRKHARPAGSYVASLFDSGTDRIIQKVGEEATEVVIAAKNGKKEPIIAEVADLLFHTLILLAAMDVAPAAVMNELEKRKR